MIAAPHVGHALGGDFQTIRKDRQREIIVSLHEEAPQRL
jgi:hypothetical protein